MGKYSRTPGRWSGGERTSVCEAGRRGRERRHARYGSAPTGTAATRICGAGWRSLASGSVAALVEPGDPARTFQVNTATTASVCEALLRNVSRDTTLYTYESRLYTDTGKEYAGHRTVKHTAKEYARRAGDVVVHTNTIENVFSIFKRGMTGVYQHCGEAHLHRYLAEFDFRHNRRSALKVSDRERAEDAVRMAAGKSLMYSQSSARSYA